MRNLPEIVVHGERLIKDYEPGEFIDALVKAFIIKKADFIILDSNFRGQKFLASCVAWAIKEGILYHDETGDDGQSKVHSFRLTDYGKAFLKNR